MQFEAGEHVKFQRDGYWRAGVFMRNEVGLAFIDSHGEFQVPIGTVKRYSPLTDEELDQWAEKELPNLLEALNKLKEDVWPSSKITFEVEGNGVNLHGSSLTIAPKAVEQASIVGFKEFPGWEIIAWATVPASHFAPEDVYDSPQGEHRNTWQAAASALQLAFTEHLNAAVEAEGMRQYAEELKRDADEVF